MCDQRNPWISVIIPVHRDDHELVWGRQELGDHSLFEVIVEEGACRGRQMNEGAARAQGQWLLFLHADTQLPSSWREELEMVARDEQVVGGYFTLRISSLDRWARVIEWGVAARVRFLKLPYGDQAFFVRRDVFQTLTGFREIQLMEDVDFARRLHRAGKVHRSRLEVSTSARRWERDGWLRRTLENILLLVLFLLGFPAKHLARIYRREATPSGTCEHRGERLHMLKWNRRRV